MYVHDPFIETIRINYTSDENYSRELTEAFSNLPEHQAYHSSKLGGYTYPILDQIQTRLESSYYQILKIARPETEAMREILETILRDPNTLYAYPKASRITVVQFDNWDNTQYDLSDLGIDITCGQKVAKRIKTLNRPFRSWSYDVDSLRVHIVSDDEFASVDILDDHKEKLLDGAFIISENMKQTCLKQFEFGVHVFDDKFQFDPHVYNLNTALYKIYNEATVFNARIFGDFIDSENQPLNLGALKGQAYVDMSGRCEELGVDFIAPASAFKKEVNTTGYHFVLIEPQNAKLGQMFSDGQTIVNLPAVYEYKPILRFNKRWFNSAYNALINDKIATQWSNLGFSRFDDNSYKMYETPDVSRLCAYNARAWLMCGGSLTQSPWLFEQIGKNIHASMQTDNDRKLRFAVPCSVRALVITESLYRLIYSHTPEDFTVEPGTARYDTEINVLVVSDIDYVEMYPSHGGCDLDDFFQIYWRTINGEKKIIICRSPNDWGEYSIFDYVEGDWHKESEYSGFTESFPEVTSKDSLWPQRLSEALEEGVVTYTGLPAHTGVDDTANYDADFVLAMMDATSDAAASVGINVNARQLYSASAQRHRSVQVCSMEDAIDAGVQGGTEEQVSLVIDDGQVMIDELIDEGIEIDDYLWTTKHERFSNRNKEVKLVNGNVSYLHSVRYQLGKHFMEQVYAYSQEIPNKTDFSKFVPFGRHYYNQARTTIQIYRRYLAVGGGTGSSDYANSWLLKKINSYEDEHHKNSFLISLFIASISMSTSTGRYTDQIVMQPDVFPYLLSALQFYGIMGEIYVNDKNQLKRRYRKPPKIYDNDTPLQFEDMKSYQNWGLKQHNEEFNEA